MRGSIAIVTIGVFGLASLALAATQFQERPTTTDNGTTLTVSGHLNGLSDRGVVTIRVRATGTGAVTCQASGSSGESRSAQPSIITAGVRSMHPSDFTNGTAAFSVTTGEPSPAAAKGLGCPDDEWTATVDDVTFKTVVIRVTQGGRTVLTRTLTL